MADLLHDRPTPFLLVDEAVAAANITDMADSTRRRGLALRPHAKTHKSADLARLQLDAGAVGLTVATVAEAEIFADAGCEDLFVAYPLWVDAAKGARLRELSSRVALTIGVDSVAGALALDAQLPGARALVEVDSGQHRSGTAPAEAGALAEVAVRAGLDVAGVFTFPGHSYAPGVAAEVAAEEAAALREAAASLRAARRRARRSSAEARRRARPRRTATCSPSCGRGCTSSVTRSSGSSTASLPIASR